MPTVPWTAIDAPDHATATVLVMASRFRLSSYRSEVPFLRDAMRIRAQVRRADGALGVSLVAHPLRREFWTLSAWRDRDALDALVTAEPHRSVMRSYGAAMADSAFVFWEASAAELPVDWAEARRRVEQ